MRITVFFLLLIYTCAFFGKNQGSNKNFKLTSPDTKVQIEVCIADNITYSVYYGEEQILMPSSISMNLQDGLNPGVRPELKNTKKRSVNNKIYPQIMEKRKEINDVYNELELEFQGNYGLIFRAYNDGVAYRFKTSFAHDIKVYGEESVFQFPSNDTIYFAQVNCDAKPGQDCFHSSFEELYKVIRIGDLAVDMMAYAPVVVCLKNVKVAITETDLVDYPGMFITGTNDGTNSLKAKFAQYPSQEKSVDFYNVVVQRADYIAQTKGSRYFPWRTLTIAPKDGDLIESDMLYRLGGETQLDDLSWLKPGKSTSEWLFDNNIYGVDFKSGCNTDTYIISTLLQNLILNMFCLMPVGHHGLTCLS